MVAPVKASVALLGLVLGLTAALLVLPAPAAHAAVTASCRPSLPLLAVGTNGAVTRWTESAPATAGGISGPATVGRGWPAARTVLPAGAGVTYVLGVDGRLRWYRDLATSGTPRWAAGSGRAIGTGWGGFAQVASAGGGVLYALAADGTLRWYRHRAALTGTVSWAPGSGRVVSRSVLGSRGLVAGITGVLYAVDQGGALRWYRHDGWGSGLLSWAPGSGRVIGNGWGGFVGVTSAGGGVLYAVARDGSVRWFAHLGAWSGASAWAAGSGSRLRLQLPLGTVLGADPTACTGLNRDSVADVRAMAASQLRGRGYPQSHFPCIDGIFAKESRWRWNAVGPAGAYGIPQALPGRKMGSVASDWSSNPITQVTWGLDYMEGRYGSPCGAWSYWQRYRSY